jgi:hypothetical protein
LLKPEAVHAPFWLVAVIALAVVLKMGLAWFAMTLARATGSTTLLADAWNHIFDIMSSGLVLLALVCARLGWGAVDGWAALLVAGFIMATGVRCARDASIRCWARRLPGNLSRDRNRRFRPEGGAGCMTSSSTPMAIRELSRCISRWMRVERHRGHDIAEKTEQAVEEALDCKAIVHVDPVDRAHPWYPLWRKTFGRRSAATGACAVFTICESADGPAHSRFVGYLVSKDLPAEVMNPSKNRTRSDSIDDQPVQEVVVTIETEYSNETQRLTPPVRFFSFLSCHRSAIRYSPRRLQELG